MAYDFLQLDRESGIPLYRQLYTSIRQAVEAGYLKKNEKLPSIRKLAEDLSLSCTTVESAYQQLCVEGYLYAQPHRGFFARDARRDIPLKESTVPAVRIPGPAPPVPYDFGSDYVDSRNIDIKNWRRHIRDVLNRQAVIASYGDPQGEPELRKALSTYSYAARGVLASPEQIVIGAGTQALLSILCGLLRNETTSVVMEEPGFRQAEQVFTDCGFAIRKLLGDEDGLTIRSLEQIGAKLAFISPSNRVRTGSSIPMNRRFELMKWARESGATLIEDDHNGELRYRTHPIPALQGLGGEKSVVYLGSFSKLLLPSVRIGYMVLTPELLERYRLSGTNYNQTASKIEQLALGGYIQSGQMERHLRRLRKLYRAKSECLLSALKSAFGGTMGIQLQETPLCVILSPHIDKSARELCDAARKQGVRVQSAENGNPGKIRLGFAGIPLEKIEEAVQCLKIAWKS